MDINDLGFELPQLPSSNTLQEILRPFDMLLTDVILWLCYGISILSILKFIIYTMIGPFEKSTNRISIIPQRDRNDSI